MGNGGRLRPPFSFWRLFGLGHCRKGSEFHQGPLFNTLNVKEVLRQHVIFAWLGYAIGAGHSVPSRAYSLQQTAGTRISGPPKIRKKSNRRWAGQ
jgi:hypothetical protein